MRPKSSTNDNVLRMNMKNMNLSCLENPTNTVKPRKYILCLQSSFLSLNKPYYHKQTGLNKKTLTNNLKSSKTCIRFQISKLRPYYQPTKTSKLNSKPTL